MKPSDQAPHVEIRYKVQGHHIIDSEKRIQNGNPIYIREILDSGSHEFKSSEISFKDRLDIVGSLGLKVLIHVLDECFKSGNKEYDAANEAILALGELLNSTYPALKFNPVVDDSKSSLSLQLVNPIYP